MPKSRKATPVTLTESQRGRLESLWFHFGNHGPKTTPGNHQFIQCLLEHGVDIRPLRTKRTAKRDIPTEECVSEVEAVLARAEGRDGDHKKWPLRLVPPAAVGRRPEDPDPELKALLREMRERVEAPGEARGHDHGGEDAA